MALNTPLFTSGEVLAFAGVTQKNIADWHRAEIIESLKAGRVRLYTARQMLEVAVVAALRRLGLSRRRIKRATDWLRTEGNLLGILDGVVAGHDFWFVTDGQIHGVCPIQWQKGGMDGKEVSSELSQVLELHWGDGKRAVAVFHLSEIMRTLVEEVGRKLFGAGAE